MLQEDVWTGTEWPVTVTEGWRPTDDTTSTVGVVGSSSAATLASTAASAAAAAAAAAAEGLVAAAGAGVGAAAPVTAATELNATVAVMAELPHPSTLEALVITVIIFMACVAIIMANLIIIATFLNFRGPAEVINIYLLSLAVADLLLGLLVVPLSVYAAMVQQWVYGDLVCRLVGYVEVTLWSVSVFTFMWMSVDRYLAVQRPLRYDTVQKHTHCRCWMVFTWVSAAMLCCPPLLGFNKPSFDRDAYVCMLDWGNMAAYSVTVAFLVLGPSLITIVYAYSYIFTMMSRLRSGAPIHDKEYASALSENLSNPNHVMSFVLVVSFWVSWTPYAAVKLYEYFANTKFQIPYLHFGIVWLGILNSFFKSVILVTLSPQFRLAARIVCIKLCRRYKGRLQSELISMEEDD
ncbi:G-protein coupled receptor 52-like [Schistocerca piceifrons]|uniref:G-protein coupled receptor 52-like n=1 Tax=Schistocerca piceifrons TaxID=274613 RepID=UPI001F5EEFB5|nr:G-protein coupled receptor 52-like [Schistocerca piceifrons]